MKLWDRYQRGFINHDKFRAITSNAIALWLEGKNYADEKLTDGLLPDYEVKHWRFFGRKSVSLLTTSCGLKPGTDQPYAPLWEVVDGFGFKMHDYLDHNDCRETVQERIAAADARRATRATNQKAYRDRMKTEEVITEPITPLVTEDQRLTALPDKQKHNHNHNQKDQGARTFPESDAEQFFDAYRAHWKAAYGHECSLQLNPLEFMKLEQQIGACGFDRLTPALAAYFNTPDLFVRNTAKHSLALFLKDPMKYLAGPAKVAPTRPRQCKHDPACFDDAAHTSKDLAERRQQHA